MLDALAQRGFIPAFVAVPPEARADDRSAMESWAHAHRVELWVSKRLTEHLDRLEALDLLVVCRFALLPVKVFSRPRWGAINVHSSLLPRYRGVHPVSWALIEGASETGVTVHIIDAGIDTGSILRQASMPIDDRHDLHALQRDLDALSAVTIVELMQAIEDRGGLPAGRPQSGPSSYARRRRPEDGQIDWRTSARGVFNLVRALPSPLPPAFAVRQEDGARVDIVSCRLLDDVTHALPGTVEARAADDAVVIACGDGHRTQCVTRPRLQPGDRLQ